MPNPPTDTPSGDQQAYIHWQQLERIRTMDAYTAKFVETDLKILERHREFSQEFERAYSVAIFTYGLIGLANIGLLIISVVTALQDNISDFRRNLAIGGIVVSLVLLIILLNRSPLRSLRHAMADSIKMNAIFLGYMRQLAQIDLTFRDQYLFNLPLDDEKVKGMVEQIQNAVDQTVDSVGKSLDDSNGFSS